MAAAALVAASLHLTASDVAEPTRPAEARLVTQEKPAVDPPLVPTEPADPGGVSQVQTFGHNTSLADLEALPLNLNGETQPLDTVIDLVCPEGSLLESLLGPLCRLNVLDFEFATRFDADGATVERTHTALLNVPTLLDVDNDLGADLVATLQVLSLRTFTLRVERALGQTGPLPVSVEAIVDDPTEALPRQFINFGYDARMSTAPDLWRSTITLPVEADPNLTTINIDTTVRTGGDSVAALGGLFDGEALDRSDPMGGHLQYSPVPDEATLGLTLGRYIEARAGASAATTLSGGVDLIQGPSEQHLDINLTDLPEQVAVRYSEPGADQRTVQYTATADVPSLDATYTQTDSGTLATKVTVELTDVPEVITFKQLSPTHATFAADSPVGSVEFGAANGEPRMLAVDHPYVRVLDNGPLQSYAGRVDELLSASIAASGRIEAELQLGQDEEKPFRAVVDRPDGHDIVADVSNLPRHLRFGFDSTAGILDYDAFGETVAQIAIDARRKRPFFGRVTHVAATLSDLPSEATMNLRPDGSGIKVATDKPIGDAEVLLTSGPKDVSLPDGALGAQVEDTDAHFAAFARVEGLRLVDITTAPSGEDTKVDAHVQLASTPLLVHHESDDRTIDAELSPVPTELSLSFDPTAGTVGYDANAGIDRIRAEITSTKVMFGRVKHIDAIVERIPQQLSVGFKPASGSGGAFTASTPVGMAEVHMTDGQTGAPPLPDQESGLRLIDIPSAFAMSGRLFEVQGARLTTSGSDFDATLDTGPLADDELQDVSLVMVMNDPDDAVSQNATVTATIEDLPNHLELHHRDAFTTYQANGSVPKVTLSADYLPGGDPGDPMEGGLHFIRGTFLDVPKEFKIIHLPLTNWFGMDSPAGAFTRVDLEAWDAGPRNPTFPEDGRNKVDLNIRDDRLHGQARVFNLGKVVLSGTNRTKVETRFGSKPAPMDVALHAGTAAMATEEDAGPLDAWLTIDDLPQESTFEFSTLLGIKVKWKDIAPGTGGTTVTLNLSAKDVGLKDLEVELPAEAEFCVGSQSDCDPQSPSRLTVDGDLWLIPNQFIATSTASGVVRVQGNVCLPPTDSEGDRRKFPGGVVYASCQDGTETNRIVIGGLRFRNFRVELRSGDTAKWEGSDWFEEGTFKLWFQSDSHGLSSGLHIQNETSESETIVRGKITHTGDYFFGLYDLDFPWETERVHNRLNCNEFSVDISWEFIFDGYLRVIPDYADRVDICT